MAKVKFKGKKLNVSYENGKKTGSNTSYNPQYTAQQYQKADRPTRKFIRKEAKRAGQAANQQMAMQQSKDLARYGTIGGVASQAVGGRTLNNVTDNISRGDTTVKVPQQQTTNKEESKQETSNNSSDNVLGWIK